MNTTGNAVLITGGATGIGFALADAFSKAGNKVAICGRRERRLLEAKRKLPDLHVRTCDVADPEARTALLEWTIATFGNANILVNNAGIQRPIDFRNGTKDFPVDENEIETNLAAPIHLSALFIPHLTRQPEAAIVNISSGLAFIPLAAVPVYCATKAALHSFSWSLRHQLQETSVKVFEILPPMVATELHGGSRRGRGRGSGGIAPSEVAHAMLSALANDEYEVAVGGAQSLRAAAREAPEQTFHAMNTH